MQVRSLNQEDPQEEGMATHSSILAWRILWTEEPGGLQSIGSQRVGYDMHACVQLTTPTMCLYICPEYLEYCLVSTRLLSLNVFYRHN